MTAVEDGGGGAFAVGAVVVLFTLVRLRTVTVDIPVEKYIDFEDTKPSLPSLPRIRR